MPVPLCVPERAGGVAIDTSSGTGGPYLRIARVIGMDSEADELGVSFGGRRGAREGVVTIRRRQRDAAGGTAAGIDEIRQLRLPAPDHGVAGDQIPADDVDGSIGGGAATPRGDTLLVAARASGSLAGDYDIFAARYRDAALESPRRMPVSEAGSWDAQPALSPDGDALYFASDRPGGLGGTDIWVSRRAADGSWSAPVDLGPGINTPCDELTPFVSSDGRWLYYSSSGRESFGGYDLFRAPISRGEVGGARNVGAPVNTPSDELYPSAPAGADPDTLLYYSSNQTGSRGFDLYVLHRVIPASPVASRPRRGDPALLTGTVTTNEGVPVDSALVTIDPHEGPTKKDSTYTDPGGRYEFQVERGKSYEVIAGSESTLYSREEVKIPLSGGKVVTRNIPLPDTVTFRINFPFNNATDPYEFTLDDRGLPGGDRWTEVIDRMATFLKRTPDGGAVEIVGHTDPVGSNQFNLDLGRRRAEFVLRALIARGVPAATLRVRSEGEEQPLASRAGESEEIYHARLRRVELIRK